MPRVTDEYRAARREQVVQAALRCVERQGFHKATMADVIGESGLSAGAVYGYFTSKDEILWALAEGSIGHVAVSFDQLLADGAAPHPAEVLEVALDRLLGVNEDVDITVIAVQAWAEAARGGAIRDIVAPRIREVRERWIEVARRFQAAGGIHPDADPEQIGRALLGLMPGFIVQRLILGEVSTDGYAAAVRALIDS